MDELQTTMTIYRVWGSHLGSSQLFKQHLESRRRITEFVEKVQVRNVFLISGSCYLDRVSIVEFSVECLFLFFQPTQKSDLKIVQITKSRLF